MTDTPDFRALCAELADQLDDALDFTVSSDTRSHMKALVGRARAALAAAAQEPSDEDLLQMAADAIGYESIKPGEYECEGSAVEAYGSELIAFGRAALAAAPQGHWQPIDTAPRDGTEIIGWDGDSVQIIHWDTWSRPRWGDRNRDHFYPTHWLLIPAVPELPQEPAA